MRRIGRYLFAEALGPCATSLLVFTLLLLINLLFEIAELAIRRQVPLAILGKFLVLAMPRILVLTLPMAVLLGILVGVGRLSADGEITALRACGVSFHRMVPPLLLLGVVGTALSGYASLVLVPEANYAQHRLNAEIFFSGDLHRNIQPGVFYQNIPGLLLYAREVEPDVGMRDVVVYQRGDDGIGQLTVARRARLEPVPETGQLRFHLEDGESHRFDPARPDRYERSRFQTQMLLRAPDPAMQDFVRTLRGPLPRNIREMSTPALAAEVTRLETEPPVKRRFGYVPAQIEMHRRFAVPLAAAILSLLGVPLGVVIRRGGRSSGFAIALGVLVAYWLLFSAGENLARSGALRPWVAIWLPNTLFLAVAVVLLAWQSQDRRLPHRWSAAVAGMRQGLVRLAAGIARLAPRRAERRTPAAARRSGGMVFPGRVDRYLSAAYLRSFLLVLACFFLLYVLADLRSLLDDITGHAEATGRTVARYFAFAAPGMLLAALPVASLLATLIALGLLQRHNEITALRAAGISLHRMALPLLVIGALLGALQFVVSDAVVPEAGQTAAALRARIRNIQPASGFAARRWVFGADRRLYYLTAFSPSLGAYQGVSIFQLSPDSSAISERIEARSARFVDDSWLLTDGWVREFTAEGETFRPFQEEHRTFPESPDYLSREVRKPAEMSFAALREAIADLERAGYDVRDLEVARHEKVAMASIPVVLILLGLPFAIRSGGGGALAGIGLAMALVVVYYICLATCRQLGGIGLLPPALAAWSPSTLFGCFGLYRMIASRG
jgi:LPS export ABC transporter permease LptG/LPS export ABC transporter permease LptF